MLLAKQISLDSIVFLQCGQTCRNKLLPISAYTMEQYNTVGLHTSCRSIARSSRGIMKHSHVMLLANCSKVLPAISLLITSQSGAHKRLTDCGVCASQQHICGKSCLPILRYHRICPSICAALSICAQPAESFTYNSLSVRCLYHSSFSNIIITNMTPASRLRSRQYVPQQVATSSDEDRLPVLRSRLRLCTATTAYIVKLEDEIAELKNFKD